MDIESQEPTVALVNQGPAEIEAREFAVAWRGYDRSEVRVFLRDIALAIERLDVEADTEGAPVPETVEVHEFTMSWRGYDRSEVRAFLREVAADVRARSGTESESTEAALDTFFGEATEHDDAPASDEPAEVASADEAADAPAEQPDDRAATDPQAAVLDRAASAAMAVRADARRASRVMRTTAGAYVEKQQFDAERLRREADEYAIATRAAADRDALAVRTMLTARSSAALRARTAAAAAAPAAAPPPIEPEPEPRLDTREDADLHRLRTDLARAQTSIARLEAELDTVRSELRVARRGSTAADASAPEVVDLRRREDALAKEQARLDTLRTEVEAMRANATEQRTEAERLRLEAQRLRDDARDIAGEPTPVDEPPSAEAADEPAPAEDEAPPEGEAPPMAPARGPADRPTRPVSGTTPPGLGFSPEVEHDPDAASAGGDLADMVRDALDAGLDDDS